MKIFLSAMSLAILIAGWDPSAKKVNHKNEREDNAGNLISPADTTPKVTGVGGIFFYSDDPHATREWYTKNLGIEMTKWGSASFESKGIGHPDEVNALQWKPFKTGDKYFVPSKKDFMIDYTVQNIEGLVRRFKANGVTVLDTIESYDYGKFVHLMDAEGNKIELWEPTHAHSSH